MSSYGEYDDSDACYNVYDDSDDSICDELAEILQIIENNNYDRYAEYDERQQHIIKTFKEILTRDEFIKTIHDDSSLTPDEKIWMATYIYNRKFHVRPYLYKDEDKQKAYLGKTIASLSRKERKALSMADAACDYYFELGYELPDDPQYKDADQYHYLYNILY